VFTFLPFCDQLGIPTILSCRVVAGQELLFSRRRFQPTHFAPAAFGFFEPQSRLARVAHVPDGPGDASAPRGARPPCLIADGPRERFLKRG
jgi:hypothetical protein